MGFFSRRSTTLDSPYSMSTVSDSPHTMSTVSDSPHSISIALDSPHSMSTVYDSPHSMRSTTSDSPHSMRSNSPDSPYSMRSTKSDSPNMRNASSDSPHSMRSTAPDSPHSMRSIASDFSHTIRSTTSDSIHSMISTALDSPHSMSTVSDSPHNMRSTTSDSPHMQNTTSDSPHSMRSTAPDSPHTMISTASDSPYSMRSTPSESSHIRNTTSDSPNMSTAIFTFQKLIGLITTQTHLVDHIFINKILDMFLYQHITEYIIERANPSLLDLILTNEEGMVNDIQYVSHLDKSDHVCLVFNTNMYASTVENIKPRYVHHRGNYKNINKNLKQIDWYKRLENINAENACVFFEEVLSNEMEKNVPKSRTKKRRPYINRHTERKIKKKYYLWKRFKETNLDHEEYKKNEEIVSVS